MHSHTHTHTHTACPRAGATAEVWVKGQRCSHSSCSEDLHQHPVWDTGQSRQATRSNEGGRCHQEEWGKGRERGMEGGRDGGRERERRGRERQRERERETERGGGETAVLAFDIWVCLPTRLTIYYMTFLKFMWNNWVFNHYFSGCINMPCTYCHVYVCGKGNKK